MNRRSLLLLGVSGASFLLARSAHASQSDDALPNARLRDISDIPAFRIFDQIGGQVGFAIFDDVPDTDLARRDLVKQTLSKLGPFDEEAFDAIHEKTITESQFFGDWYDMQSGNLIKVGGFRTSDGVELVNPTLKSLSGHKITSSDSSVPAPGSGAQFAYAFVAPPYGLTAEPESIQDIFDSIRATILPAGADSIIVDWTTPDLVKVSPFFEDGMEWWGILLCTIYIPSLKQLTIMVASATD